MLWTAIVYVIKFFSFYIICCKFIVNIKANSNQSKEKVIENTAKLHQADL